MDNLYDPACLESNPRLESLRQEWLQKYRNIAGIAGHKRPNKFIVSSNDDSTMIGIIAYGEIAAMSIARGINHDLDMIAEGKQL